MIRLSAASTATASLAALLLAATLFAQAGDQPAETRPVSKVRIVRLSQVKGVVHLDRGSGRGLETAIANLPIVEKSRLQTGMGVAEIEFEDNTTLRVAPNSIVEFPRLERLPGGTTVSSVELVKGMAYVSLMKTPGNEFNLLFGKQSLRLQPASHIRLQLEDTDAKLAVLDGQVRIEGAQAVTDVPRKKTVTFAMADDTQPAVAKEIETEPLDTWDHEAADFHARTAAMSALGNSPYAYGQNEMAYYGAFSNVGGCGNMWRPYFASAAWEPYSNGVWAWYEGAGYSWVSPYPWGWMPYHSGSWSYCEGAGWGWMPGGSWMGLNNTIASVRGPVKGAPVAPARGPAKGEPTLREINLKPIVHSEISSASTFIFRKDSAGLGIPREGLGKLEKLSQQSLQRGVATSPVYMDGPASNVARGHSANESVGVASIHRGMSPPSSGDRGSEVGSSNVGGGRSSGSGPAPVAHVPAGGGHH